MFWIFFAGYQRVSANFKDVKAQKQRRQKGSLKRRVSRES